MGVSGDVHKRCFDLRRGGIKDFVLTVKNLCTKKVTIRTGAL